MYSKFNSVRYNYAAFYVPDEEKYYNSYEFFGLVLEKANVEFPSRKTIEDSSFYTQGTVDSTEDVDTTPRYDNRKITLTFRCVEPENMTRSKWAALMHRMQKLNGLYSTDIYISNYDNHYEGRISINSFKTSYDNAEVTVEVTAKPYVWRKYLEEDKTFTFDSSTGIASAVVGFSGMAKGMRCVVTFSDSYAISEDFTTEAYSGQTSANEPAILGIMASTYGDKVVTVKKTGTIPTAAQPVHVEAWKPYIGE